MKYAVIRFGGKQFLVSPGEKIEVERQTAPLKPEVLLFSDDSGLKIGNPVLVDANVTAEVVEEIRGNKIRVGRFKSKSRYRKVKGHRQPLSIVEITFGEKAKKMSNEAVPVEKDKKLETGKKSVREAKAKVEDRKEKRASRKSVKEVKK